MSFEKTASVQAEISGLVSFVWDKITILAARKWNRRGMLAAYLLELQANIDLIDAVKIENFNKVSINEAVFGAFVRNLHTEAAASILLGQNRRNYRGFLVMLKRCLKAGESFSVEAELEGEKPDPGEEAAIKTVLDALSFSVRKIEVLKSLAAFAEPKSGLFPRFRLAVRLKNIRESLALQRACASRVMIAEEKGFFGRLLERRQDQGRRAS